MSNIKISSPFIRSFTHTDTVVGTSIVQLIAAAPPEGKRILVVIQNKSSTATVTVLLNATSTNQGISLPPSSNISIDNYNGPVRVIASATGTTVNLSIGSI